MKGNKAMVKQRERGKMMAVVWWSLLCLLINSWAYAEPLSPKEPIIEHLEFLGYESDQVEAGIRAKHISKIPLYIIHAFGGIRMQTGFPGNPTDSDVESRYKVTNALGKQLSIMKVYWSDEGNLFAMAWMPGSYEKGRFALFMEAWDHDASLLQQSYNQLKPFLKEPPKEDPKEEPNGPEEES